MILCLLKSVYTKYNGQQAQNGLACKELFK